MRNWEFYFLSIIKGERKGIFAGLFRFILLLCSCPYQWAVALRNWFFDHGWLNSYTPPVPLVISVGNLTAGGTGKTPVTLMIAQELQKEALLAILSRGYRSHAEKFSTPILLHKNKGLLHPASLCGDEPYLLADNLPNAFVIVGRDRYLSSKLAAKFGAEVLVLDDGMQHRGIARDLEVVVMDLLDPFGCGYFLPRGLLRESRRGLARADLIILNHAHDQELFYKVKRQLSLLTSAPVVGTCTEVIGVFDLKNKAVTLPEKARVALFCAIAHPEYFRSTVDKLGTEVVDHLSFADHDSFDLNRLMDFSISCYKKEASWLLCTEKDRVKLINSSELKVPVGWVKTKLRVVEGTDSWNDFMVQAKTKFKTSTHL